MCKYFKIAKEMIITQLLQLKYFKALAESGHLTQTAKDLYISAPSLSETISRLESELNVELFDHVGKNIVLNDNGKIFLKYVNKALEALINGQKAMKDRSSLSKISIVLTSLPIWFNMLQSFHESYPDIELNVKTITPQVLNEGDNSLNFDYFLGTINDINSDIYNYIKVFNCEKPVLMVSHNNNLSKESSINLADAKEETFISIGKVNLSSTKYLYDICALAGFIPKKVIEGDYFIRMKLILENVGVGLTTDLGSEIQLLDNPALVAVPINAPILTRTQVIAWHKDSYESFSAIKLKNYLFDYFAKHQSDLKNNL